MLNTIVLGNESNLPSRTFSISKVSKHTLYKDKWELRIGNGSGKGRIRRQGGGRKYLPGLHPEWIDALKIVIESYTAEVPQ
ncbi:hypothetical protein LGV59_02195 [Bacteroides fragilis]|nr:hypothetical protein [Bacteroides fragilis]